jgi:hypothetical protein
MFDKACLDIENILKANGIGTYVIILKDPDSGCEYTATDGSAAWIIGQGHLLAFRATRDHTCEEADA